MTTGRKKMPATGGPAAHFDKTTPRLCARTVRASVGFRFRPRLHRCERGRPTRPAAGTPRGR